MARIRKAFTFAGVIMMAVASAGANNPTTVPASPGVGESAGRPLVEVFAFSAVGEAGQQAWIGKGIQENLQTDVSRTGALLVIAPQQPVAGADPVAAAKQNGANLAVIGSYQTVGDQVRVNGHLIDAATNNAVGSFSATGPEKDLFQIEDALGEQLRRSLPLPAAPPQVDSAGATASPITSPVVTYVSQPAPYYDSSDATPYYYPDSFYPSYYGYDYPFGGFYGGVAVVPGPFIFGGGWGGRFYGHRDFGRSGRNFNGGLRPNPTFHNPVVNGGGRSFGGFHGGGGFRGGGGQR